MKKLKLLDCTLRDGGYVNDWQFGHSVITGTYKRLDVAGVDYIEVGFLDDRRAFDNNRSIVPHTDCFNEIFKGVTKKYATPVAMVDFGTCSIENIGECESTFIDGIRVIFKKEKIEEALPFCKAIKEKGYKLFVQAISITAYSDMDMLKYVQKINEIKPYAFSIVDTYGLLDSGKLTHYFNLINNNLDSEIAIGYHSHNNFQLAFSNTIKFLSLETNRTLVADSTVYGMGKSAGNCPSELIAMHMNEHFGTHYDVCQFLEVLDTDLMAIYQKQYWGYRYNFFISAMQNCHPEYVQYLLDKKTLTVSAINEILSHIPKQAKLLYDSQYIERAYIEYQSHSIDDQKDVERLKKEVSNQLVILLGPGKSIFSQREEIKKIIAQSNAIVMGVNSVPMGYEPDFLFVSNAKRYSKLADADNNIASKFIITSNITPFDRKPDFILNYQTLLQQREDINDNALLLCLTALCKCGVREVKLAGFDGFSDSAKDYYDVSYSFAGNEMYRVQSNNITKKALRDMGEKIAISFLTKSLYQED